jgi:hypothetical protein
MVWSVVYQFASASKGNGHRHTGGSRCPGTRAVENPPQADWIPAFAGMTNTYLIHYRLVVVR